MKKTQLVIASILKPVDDTRMYEKFGLSLSQTNKYDINIIGFYSKNIPQVSGITFYPLFNFKRLSLSRLFAPVICLKKLLKLKPQILIVNTHELLLVTWLYKILFGCKLLYDVRENYYRNILYTKAFPWWLRPIIATYVRAKEYISTLFVNHYLLAEKQYTEEFTFSKGKSTVIENKFKPIPSRTTANTRGESSYTNLIFSGTLAESTGVFQAIRLAHELHNFDNNIRLHIIGYCSMSSTLSKIKKEVEAVDYIQLTGAGELVSHYQILEAIEKADFGIIHYPTNYSTMNSTPTKLFEYLGSGLPILLQNHQPWVKLAASFDACLIVDFDDLNHEDLLEQMKSSQFYTTADTADILWHSEEDKLINVIDNYS